VIIKKDKNIARKIRHARVRKKVSGTEERPRLSVYRSLKHLYVQLINDENGTTLVAASTLDPALRDKVANMTKKEAARCVGDVEVGVETATECEIISGVEEGEEIILR
jgi:large subunit ribosomal protein L18